MRIGRRRQLLAFVAVTAMALCSAAGAQQTATKSVFQARGILKAVEPRTGAMMFAAFEAEGFTPAVDTMYRVSSGVGKFLRPGDTVDFIMDSTEHVILGAKLLNYEQ